MTNPYLKNVWSLEYLEKVASKKEITDEMFLYPKDHDRASIWLAKSALTGGDTAKAQELVASSVRKKDANALMVLADSLVVQGEYNQAVSIYLELDSFHSILDVAQKAENTGRLDEALKAYYVLYYMDPERGTLPLVNYYWHSEERAKAESILLQSLEQYPTSKYRQKWLRRIAKILKAKGEWSKAESILNEILRNDPGNFGVCIELGFIYYAQGDSVEVAMAQFEKAIHLSPERGDGYFAIGQLLAQEGEYDQADEWFMKALDRSPDHQWWWVAHANASRSAGNLEKALKLYLDTKRRFPTYAPAYYEIAWTYWLLGEPDQAIQAIERAIDLTETEESTYYSRAGYLYEKSGDISAALVAYKKALRRNPDDQVAKDRLQRLENFEKHNE